MAVLEDVSQHLLDAESHHEREEEALFPEVEKAGMLGPPRVMRQEHEEYLERKRRLGELVDGRDEMEFDEFARELREIGRYLVEGMRDHIAKENNVLYPAALRAVDSEAWDGVKSTFDQLGYCSFTPGEPRKTGRDER